MSIKQETSQPSDLHALRTKAIPEDVREALGRLIKEEIACVVAFGTNNCMEVLTGKSMKIMSGEQLAGTWKWTPDGCLLWITLSPGIEAGTWVESSSVCVYDMNREICRALNPT
jgi:hypothetical protein